MDGVEDTTEVDKRKENEGVERTDMIEFIREDGDQGSECRKESGGC